VKRNQCETCLGRGWEVDHKQQGQKAATLRKDCGLTQEFIAVKMQISIPYLSALENGQKKWTLTLWRNFVKACEQ
jgi:predicted transcriptional regulator